jgi:hypothetical protein
MATAEQVTGLINTQLEVNRLYNTIQDNLGLASGLALAPVSSVGANAFAAAYGGSFIAETGNVVRNTLTYGTSVNRIGFAADSNMNEDQIYGVSTFEYLVDEDE